MLDKRFVKHCTLADCQEQREFVQSELALTATRLEKLKNTQAKNPEWAAYCKYADDIVGIDIRIEEQNAVHGDLENDLILLKERMDILTQVGASTSQTPRPEEPAYQLGFFDSDKKRERMGVPC